MKLKVIYKLFNIINKEYEKIVETNDINDNIVYFINFNDFVEVHELNTIDFKKCDDTLIMKYPHSKIR